MAIYIRFSHLFYKYFLRKLHFVSKKNTLKPTLKVIRLIDSYINTRGFRYMYPRIVVYKYYIHWLFISGDLFNFHPKQ